MLASSNRGDKRMPGDVVNLNKARKAKARGAKEQRATGNRAKFGRTKAQRIEEETAAEFARRQLDGLRRDQTADIGAKPSTKPTGTKKPGDETP
jgi:Domain of unknown function (DUF4169)